MGSSHRRPGDGLIAAIVPGGCDIGPGSEDIDDRSVVGVGRPSVGDIRCAHGNCCRDVRRAGHPGILVGISL